MNIIAGSITFLVILHFSDGEKSFFDFSAVDMAGNEIKLGQYKEKVVLVVNVASECGFTDNHYKGLVKLQKLFENTGKFTVLGFPCNQFGAQEPKGEPEILKFAKERYGLNFPLFKKINVLEKDVPDYWQFLIEKSGNAPDWNFWKYLVNPKGQVLGAWGPGNDVEAIFHDVKSAVDHAVAIQSNEVKFEDITMEDTPPMEIEIEDIPLKVKKHDEM